MHCYGIFIHILYRIPHYLEIRLSVLYHNNLSSLIVCILWFMTVTISIWLEIVCILKRILKFI